MNLVIVADDLSGAAEAAGAVRSTTSAAVELLLVPSDGAPPQAAAIDTDSRGLDEQSASERVLVALRGVSASTFIYKKIDSLLRGNVSGEIAAVRASGRDVVIALATPAVGRVVRDGVVHLDGIALHQSDAWGAERTAPPASIAAALGVDADIIPLAVVRSRLLPVAIHKALSAGVIPIMDAETDRDLEAIARTVVELGRPVVAVGAGGLIRHLAPLIDLTPEPSRHPGTPGDRTIVVVGTRTSSARRQVDLLVDRGTREVILHPRNPPELGAGDVVVTLAADVDWSVPEIAAALGQLAAVIGPTPADLVLTGGSTARIILDSLGIDRLLADIEIDDGAVLSISPTGRRIVTRPGGFGGDHGLLDITDFLRERVSR